MHYVTVTGEQVTWPRHKISRWIWRVRHYPRLRLSVWDIECIVQRATWPTGGDWRLAAGLGAPARRTATQPPPGSRRCPRARFSVLSPCPDALNTAPAPSPASTRLRLRPPARSRSRPSQPSQPAPALDEPAIRRRAVPCSAQFPRPSSSSRRPPSRPPRPFSSFSTLHAFPPQAAFVHRPLLPHRRRPPHSPSYSTFRPSGVLAHCLGPCVPAQSPESVRRSSRPC